MSYLDDLARNIRNRVPADAMPDEDTDSLFRLYAVLALAKGPAVDARDVHNAWSAWMLDKDPCHSSIKPFDDLDRATQDADDPYVAAIRAAARGFPQSPD